MKDPLDVESKGVALVGAVVGHEPSGIYDVMFQWKREECPGQKLGFWRILANNGRENEGQKLINDRAQKPSP